MSRALCNFIKITIFVVLVIRSGFSVATPRLKNIANESCGFPSLIGASHKHATVVGNNTSSMETTFIYALIDPRDSSMRYVGKSDNPKRRLKGHVALARKNRTPYVSAWIRGLLKSNLKSEVYIIDEIPISEWGFWEQHYMDLFKSWGFRITNMADAGQGGDNFTNHPRREEIRKSWSVSQRAIKREWTKEMRLQMSLDRTGKSQTPCKKVKCPHCDYVGDKRNMDRWHFDFCLSNPFRQDRRAVPEIQCEFCGDKYVAKIMHIHRKYCRLNPNKDVRIVSIISLSPRVLAWLKDYHLGFPCDGLKIMWIDSDDRFVIIKEHINVRKTKVGYRNLPEYWIADTRKGRLVDGNKFHTSKGRLTWVKKSEMIKQIKTIT